MLTVSPADLARLRRNPQASIPYLAVYRPAICAYGRATADNAVGDVSIAVNGWTATKNFYRNYLVNISRVQAGDDDLGFSHFRAYTDLGGGTGTLDISPCNVDGQIGDYYTIMEYIAPMSLRPRQQSAGVLEDWDKPYTDENLNYKPLANLGPPACAFRDPLTGLATVYYHDYSMAVGVGVALTGREWYLPGSDTPSRVDDDIYATYAVAGQYYNWLVSNCDNGKNNRGFRPCFIFDPPGSGGVQPLTQFELSNLEASREGGGWTCTVTIWGEASLDDYPHAAQVVLFTRDFYGPEEVSIGGYCYGRENIKLVGWIRSGTLRRDRRKRWCEFKIEGIGPLMDNINMAACNLRDNASPTGWHELTYLSGDTATYHLLTEHSTVADITDVYIDSATHERESVPFVEGTFFDQLQSQLMESDRAFLVADARSAVWAAKYPQLFPQASRPATVVCELFPSDCIEGEIDFGDEPQELACSHLDFTGWHYTYRQNTRNYCSYAPFNVGGTGITQSVEGLSVEDQADANAVCGAYFAWLNAGYKAIVMHLKGFWPVFELAPFERVQLTVTAAEHPRGETWNQVPCWVVGVAHEPQIGPNGNVIGFMTTLILERNCGAVRGWTKTIEDPTADADDGITVASPGTVDYLPPPSLNPHGMYAVSTYDIGGGNYESFAAAFSESVLTQVAVTYGEISIYADGDITTWDLYCEGVRRVEAVRSGGAWTVSEYNAGGALVAGPTAAGSADLMTHTMANPIVLDAHARVRATITPDGSVQDYSWNISP